METLECIKMSTEIELTARVYKTSNKNIKKETETTKVTFTRKSYVQYKINNNNNNI